MKRLWREWTVDKPAAFGDWLWDVFVVQFAAFLDRLTLRQVIAFIPVVILIFAYMHRIPIPPELLLVGDLLAYIDVFAMIILLSMIGRVAVVVYVLKRAVAHAMEIASAALTGLRRVDFRHRRTISERLRKGDANRTKQDDGEGRAPVGSLVFKYSVRAFRIWISSTSAASPSGHFQIDFGRLKLPTMRPTAYRFAAPAYA